MKKKKHEDIFFALVLIGVVSTQYSYRRIIVYLRTSKKVHQVNNNS